MKLYSDKVMSYKDLRQDVLILPDNVLYREGIACGDALELSGEINDGIVLFRMVSKGCDLSKAACGYLAERFSGQPVEAAAADCRQLWTEIKADPDAYLAFWELNGKHELLTCLASPVRVLCEFFETMLTSAEISYSRADTIPNLDCDACVSSARINWSGKAENIVAAKKPRTYPTEYHRKWAAAAKLYLNEEEKAGLAALYQSMTDDDVEFLVHEKMFWSLYANLERCGIDISGDTRFKEFVYPLHRQYTVKRELRHIETYIRDEKLSAYFVKGAVSSGLYAMAQYRLHLDYDIICLTETAAFSLCSFLYRRGFRMFSGVFSLKWIDEADGRRCSGHFHLQKILNAQYKIIIDITFPAFPMGRIALFHPTARDNQIRPEDLLLVTVCHTFKHRNVFMKDINDAYMMLKGKELDLAYLYGNIVQYGLMRQVSLLFSFIFENYDLEKNQKAEIAAALHIDRSVLQKFPDWPYDEQSVYQVKRDDLDHRLHFGADHPRTYLFPIAVTKEIIQPDCLLWEDETLQVERYSDQIWRITSNGIEFYLFPMGVFMDSDYDVASKGRETVRAAAEAVLRSLGNPETYELPYAVRLRDNWYD